MKREFIFTTLCFSLMLFGGLFIEKAETATRKASNAVLVPISGVKTINNTLPTGGNNYASFAAAIGDLNANGVGMGGIIFDVTAGQTFNEAPGGTIITATGTAADPIIFQKSGGGANPVVQGTTGTWNGSFSNGDACITINGGDYITFDGIDVKDNPANANNTTRMEFGFRLRNVSNADGAQNNTIKNTTITLNRANFSAVNGFSVGILQTADSSIGGGGVAADAAATNSNNKYYNLTIKNTYAGIYLAGDSNGVFPDENCEIGVIGGVLQNTIGDSTANDIGNGSGQTWGIRAAFQRNVKIFKNEVRNVTGTGTSNVDGIFLDNFGGSTVGIGTNEIYGNQVHDIKNTNATSSTGNVVSGIRAVLPSSATSASRIYANFVYNLNNSNTNTAGRRLIGIRIQDGGNGAGATHNIDFNSVRIAPTAVSCPNSAFEIGTASGSVINVRNNIFANFTLAQTGNAKHYAWATTSATSTGAPGSISDHNILFNNATTNGFVGRTGTTDQTTLANWRTATNQDFHSKSSDPQFSSATDLHINPATATDAESGGFYFGGTLSWAAQDVDAESRNVNFPDIGADEGDFTAHSGDTITPDIFYTPLSSTTSSSNRNLTGVQITDLSGINTATGTKPRLYYKRSTDTNAFNDNTSATAGWKFVEATGAATPFDFTIDYSLLSGGAGVSAGQTVQYFVVAQDSAAAPNVGINSGTFAAAPSSVALTGTAFPVGGTINSYQILIAYSGAYIVGSGAPVYTTLKSFFDAVNTGIVTGNIIVNIAGDCAETATASLNQWAESPSGSNFTMTILPSGTRTISGTIAGAIIKLNGADRVTIDGLNTGGDSLSVRNNSVAHNSAVIWLASLGSGRGATNNTIRNSTISSGTFGSNSVSTFGIIAGSSLIDLNSFGADNDNLTVQSNTFTKTQNGIFVQGDTAISAGGNDNVTISNNVVGPAAAGANNIGATGIYVQNAVNPIISGNLVRNVIAPAGLTFQGFPAGITLSGAVNGLIAQNTVSNVTHPTTANAMYAIGILSNTNTTGTQIKGNTVSGVKATASNTGGSIVSAYGVINGGPNSQIVGNVVTSVISSSTTGCPARGIWLTTDPTNITMANNMISDIQSFSYEDTLFRWQPVGIYIDAFANNVRLYYNSVNLFGARSGFNSATMQAALFIDGTGFETGLDVRNNVFVNTYNNSTSSSDKSYAIYTNAVAGAFTNINHNDYYTSGAAGVLGFLTSDQTSISAWRGATGQDAQSLVGDPLFALPNDLRITNSSSAASDSGIPISEIITDFEGGMRSATTPDIGADEFSAPTAAAVEVGGRVFQSNNRGISRARVTMTDSQGNARTTFTNQFGYYRFAEVPAGETYIFSVAHRHYQFAQATRIQSILEDTLDINFSAISENQLKNPNSPSF